MYALHFPLMRVSPTGVGEQISSSVPFRQRMIHISYQPQWSLPSKHLGIHFLQTRSRVSTTEYLL